MKNTKYNNMSEEQKKEVIENLYVKQKLSFANIAQQFNTYPNRIRRDAQKFDILIRNRSDAQKNALQTGVSKHPTEGKCRSDEEKKSIGLSLHKNWENQSKGQRAERSKKAKIKWDAMTQNQKQNMLTAAHQAIRESSKTGSKLEKFLLSKLIEKGYKPEFHKEQILSNTKLQIDLFVPRLNTAIEVDGPSHFESVWGDESLARNKKYDEKKNGLIIGKGMKLVRIKQLHDFSKARAEMIFSKLDKVLSDIKNGKVSFSKKIIYIED